MNQLKSHSISNYINEEGVELELGTTKHLVTTYRKNSRTSSGNFGNNFTKAGNSGEDQLLFLDSLIIIHIGRSDDLLTQAHSLLTIYQFQIKILIILKIYLIYIKACIIPANKISYFKDLKKLIDQNKLDVNSLVALLKTVHIDISHKNNVSFLSFAATISPSIFKNEFNISNIVGVEAFRKAKEFDKYRNSVLIIPFENDNGSSKSQTLMFLKTDKYVKKCFTVSDSGQIGDNKQFNEVITLFNIIFTMIDLFDFFNDGKIQDHKANIDFGVLGKEVYDLAQRLDNLEHMVYELYAGLNRYLQDPKSFNQPPLSPPQYNLPSQDVLPKSLNDFMPKQWEKTQDYSISTFATISLFNFYSQSHSNTNSDVHYLMNQ
ncbi:hypothetical protein RB653_008694 [Dictyostelium firmibasis]|uniref:Uncharacterized protein n=1 Tax=Dictyostelium firmibasis TaxID=79012 RepID=A0AAN7TRH0_9MYCE